jgi:hypothetical protein
MKSREEFTAQSPVRALDRLIRGGFSRGKLAVVMARAGVGKTPFLVQIGLDHALHERAVLHLALGQTLEHVRAWYDGLFDELATAFDLADRKGTRRLIDSQRLIHAFPDKNLTRERLESVLSLYGDSLQFRPEVLIVDGYNWEGEEQSIAGHIESFKSVAGQLGMELWMSAQTHRETTSEHPISITAPCRPCRHLIDVAFFLEPQSDHTRVRLLDAGADTSPPSTHLLLRPDTLRLVEDAD